MRNKRNILLAILLLTAVGAVGCGRMSFPDDAPAAGRTPKVWPDDSGAMFPVNMPAYRFEICEEGDAFLTRITGSRSGERTLSGRIVALSDSDGKTLLAENASGELTFTVAVRNEGRWRRFEPFSCSVSPDRIDPYIAYRLIEPGYESYQRITLSQRSLESFRETAFFDNDSTGQHICVNCHHFQNRGGENFLFHARGPNGGTLLARKGKPAVKLETKSPVTDLPAVYPAWHPTLPLIVFSSNKTKQFFHSIDSNRIEVLDFFSDLLLYDIDANRATSITATQTTLETFPSWSPDGKFLYYCVAEITLPDEALKLPLPKLFERHDLFQENYREVRYNIVRRPFDEKARTFGAPETVVDAAADQKSAIHPRLSPDGRFLVYTLADYGTFPIWHRESDLWLLNVATGEKRPLDELNSPDVESYHSWDSSGRWLVFSSRREDGSYTRLYFTHCDENGQFSRPFLLPQESPGENLTRMKSYNVPEFLTEPVARSAANLAQALQNTEPVEVEWEGIEN